MRDREIVVTVNYGSSLLLASGCLPELSADFAILVVDNFSSVDEQAAIARVCQERGWILELADENLGFGGGCNRGLSRAKVLGFERALLLNPDASVSTSDVEILFSRVRTNPRALVAPIIETESGEVWFGSGKLSRWFGFATHAGYRDGATDWVTGACMALSLELGPEFREQYFLYWEDVDYSMQWIRAGGVLEVNGRARAVHAVGATQGTSKEMSTYYRCRNSLLFARTNLTKLQAVWWAAMAFPWTLRFLRHSQFWRRPGRRLVVRAAFTGAFDGLRRVTGESWSKRSQSRRPNEGRRNSASH